MRNAGCNTSGIADASKESLKNSMTGFLIFLHICTKYSFNSFKDKKVWKVGWDTVPLLINSRSRTDYTGLDIARGRQSDHYRSSSRPDRKTVNGSILNAPFEDTYFDCVVAIALSPFRKPSEGS
jgi:hypothetical protein